MADFPFFKMAAVRHLGFVLRVLGPPTKSIGGLCDCAKFGCNCVTCRVLVLLNRSGSWRERDIIISFRGDLDSTGSGSQIVRLFSTV